MGIVVKPLGVVALMAGVTAVASLAIYATGPKVPAADAKSSDGFGEPLAPVPAATPVASAAAGDASPTQKVPALTTPVLQPGLGQWQLQSPAPSAASRSVVPDPSAADSNKQFVRAVVTKVVPDKPYVVQFVQGVGTDIPDGQNLVLRVTAKSPTSQMIDVAFLGGADYHADLLKKVTLTPNWKTYSFPFTTSQTYLHQSKDNGAVVCAHVGYGTGTVDLSDLQVYPASMVAKK